MRDLRGIGTHPMEVPLSETPTDPNPTDTVNAATETGEKMIPLSAVAPLIGYVEHMIGQGAIDHAMPPVLLAAYDRAAQVAGYPSHATIYDVDARMEELSVRRSTRLDQQLARFR